MRMVRRKGVAGLVILAFLVVGGLAAGAYQAQASLSVMCGGYCVSLLCIPPAPPSTACVLIASGCGSQPSYPDCLQRDIFSPE